MPSVKMFYLRSGQEFRLSRAERTVLSLYDKRHKEAGIHGSSHMDAFDAVFLLPKKPEYHESWEKFVESKPPVLRASQCNPACITDEMKFWPQPRELDEAPGPDALHEEIVRIFGTWYRINGVDRATQQDRTNQEFNPVTWGAAAAVVIGVFVIGVMALWWFLS